MYSVYGRLAIIVLLARGATRNISHIVTYVMKTNKAALAALGSVAALLIVAGFGVRHSRSQSLSRIASYDACAAAGYPILETYPEQCRLPDGRSFTRIIENEEAVSAPIEDEVTEVKAAAFNAPLTLRIGTSLTFADGASLTLIGLNDSRCRAGHQCIWEGEISAVFSVKRAGGMPQELRLGTVSNKSASLAGYSFTLQSATPESAIVIVSPG